MQPVAELADLEEGVPRIVAVGSRRIALTLWEGRVFASKDVCPHQSTSFDGGHARCPISSAGPGLIAGGAGAPTLVCPWHAWQFDLASGVCSTSPRYRVRTYPVEIKDGTVHVDLAARRSRDREAASPAADDVRAAPSPA
ncbi:MAG: Rieske (2Fe-2S) protein [Solirubrobacterales bacterium]